MYGSCLVISCNATTRSVKQIVMHQIRTGGVKRLCFSMRLYSMMKINLIFTLPFEGTYRHSSERRNRSMLQFYYFVLFRSIIANITALFYVCSFLLPVCIYKFRKGSVGEVRKI